VLLESKEQIRTGALIYREYQMSYTVRGFMMANNINYAAFDGMKSTSFQHQLTQENLDIIESSVNIAEQNNFEPNIKAFAEQTCNLAVAAQQLNQLAKCQEAQAVTDLNDSYARYLELIAGEQAEAKAFRDLGVGVYKGTERGLRAWGQFAGKLATQPVTTTVNEIGGSCLAVGNVLLRGAGNLVDQALFGPARDSCNDFMQDMQELREKGIIAERKRRSQIRREENIDAIKDAYIASLEMAQQVIINMSKKTAEENIADATQFIVEGIITQKVATCVLQLSKFVGSGLVQGGLELLDKVPSSILDKPIEFMVTPGGAVMGVLAETGESVADIIIAAGQELAAPFEKSLHFAAQANNLARKGGGSSNGGKPEVDTSPKRNDFPVWDNTTIEFFENLKNNPERKAFNQRFGNFYKDSKTDLWWSKDNGLHGGPHYKVFKETAKGFEHQFNADLLGIEIIGQHKGPVGSFIPKSDIRFK